MDELFDRRTAISAAGAMLLFAPSALAQGVSGRKTAPIAASDISRGRRPVILHAPPSKWREVTQRHAAQDKKRGLADRRCRWVQLCRATGGAAPDLPAAQMINELVNMVPYRSDRQDTWSTPREFGCRGGDCEDFAIAKYFLLRRLGFSKENVGILVCLPHKTASISHAVTLLNHGGNIWVLDNLSKKRIYKYKTNKSLVPIFYASNYLSIGFL